MYFQAEKKLLVEEKDRLSGFLDVRRSEFGSFAKESCA